MKEERRKKLVFELNNSGDYFVIKEKLKKSIVRIVKEKFQFQVCFPFVFFFFLLTLTLL